MVGAWCRGLVGVLVVVAAAAIELFDELPAGEDAVYQSDNDINSDMLFPQKTQNTHDVSEQDVMLYRILKALQMASRNSPELSSNRLEEGDERPAHHDPSDGLMMKRYAGFLTGSAKLKNHHPYFASRRAEKKKGSHQICYFKLCSFGTPM